MKLTSSPARYCGSTPSCPVRVGVAGVHRREPGGDRQVVLRDVPAAPEHRVGDRIAQPQHQVVDLHHRVLVRAAAERRPARRVAPALRAGAADRAVLARVVEPRTVELEEHLGHAAVHLGVVAGGDHGIGHAEAQHVGLPGPERVVAVDGAKAGVGCGLGAVVEPDPEAVLALPAVLDHRLAVERVGAGREGAPGAVDHHPAEPRRDIGELDHEGVVLVLLAVRADVDQIASRGVAAEDDRPRGVVAELHALLDARGGAPRLRHQRPADGGERHAEGGLLEDADQPPGRRRREPESAADGKGRGIERGAGGGQERGDRSRDRVGRGRCGAGEEERQGEKERHTRKALRTWPPTAVGVSGTTARPEGRVGASTKAPQTTPRLSPPAASITARSPCCA